MTVASDFFTDTPDPGEPIRATWGASVVELLQDKKITAAEIAAGVTPVSFQYGTGVSLRNGATGDNSTDNTSAFQNAYNSNTGGRVYVPSMPSAVYRALSTITPTNRTVFHGDGLTTTVLFNPSSNGDSLFAGTNLDNIVFRDFQISGSVGTATGRRGLDFNSTVSRLLVQNVYFDTLDFRCIVRDGGQYDCIENCRFLNTDYSAVGGEPGVAIYYSTFANRLRIVGCRFAQNDMAVRILAGHAVSISECSFEGDGDSGGTITSQIYISDCFGVKLDNLYIEAERTGAGVGVIRLDECEGVTLSNSILHGDIGGTTYSDTLVHVVTPASDTIIQGCRFSEVLNYFVRVEVNTGGYIVRMRGCTFYDGGARITTYAGIMAKMSAPVYIELDGIPHNETYNPGSLADGAGETTTFAVTGVALGDIIEASFSLDLQGIVMTAFVQSAGNVSVRFQNETGGVLDLASGTISVFVKKTSAA